MWLTDTIVAADVLTGQHHSQCCVRKSDQQTQLWLQMCWPVIKYQCCVREDNQQTHSVKWRHNERDCVSNHSRLDCLLNRLFRRRSKKTSKLRVWPFVRGIHRRPVNSPHKWPVTQKMFPFDDVTVCVCKCIISHQLSQCCVREDNQQTHVWLHMHDMGWVVIMFVIAIGDDYRFAVFGLVTKLWLKFQGLFY